MAGFARVVAAGVPHHVMQCGNGRRYILDNDTDRAVYLGLLVENMQQHRVSLLGYCLMSNHVHLVMIPDEAESLALAMKHTHGRYASDEEVFGAAQRRPSRKYRRRPETGYTFFLNPRGTSRLSPVFLTKMQATAHPEIERTGATVMGKGKHLLRVEQRFPQQRSRSYVLNNSHRGNMAIDQADLIDLMSLDQNSGDVVLTISDHLEWGDGAEHQRMLQAKFNAYFVFIESGELIRRYPESSGRSIVLRLVMKCKPDNAGWNFLHRARAVIEGAGYQFREEIFAESYDN